MLWFGFSCSSMIFLSLSLCSQTPFCANRFEEQLWSCFPPFFNLCNKHELPACKILWSGLLTFILCYWEFFSGFWWPIWALILSSPLSGCRFTRSRLLRTWEFLFFSIADHCWLISGLFIHLMVASWIQFLCKLMKIKVCIALLKTSQKLSS